MSEPPEKKLKITLTWHPTSENEEEEEEDRVVAVDDDVSRAVIRLSEIDPNLKVDKISARQDMNCFLEGVKTGRDLELCEMYLNLFVSLSCGKLLCTLYLSNVKYKSETGALLIKRFLAGVDEFSWCLRVNAAPVVIQMCTGLRDGRMRDEVYYKCRRVLGQILETVNYEEPNVSVFRRLVAWREIFPLVKECGEKLLDEFVAFSEFTSEGIIEFESAWQFCSFVRAVVNGMLESVRLDNPIWMPYGVLAYPFYEQLQSLYQLFGQLRDNFSLCLARVDQYLDSDDAGGDKLTRVAPDFFDVLKALHEISKIYKGAGESIRLMLEMRKAAFDFLIMEHAKDDISDEDDNSWIFEYKESLSFEVRSCLARRFLLHNYEDAGLVGFEMLVDRSSLLADSCDLVTQAEPESLQNGLAIQFKNEEANGDGVLREWFALVCKAVFNSENALFSTGPNDLTRFYINPASDVQPRHLDYFRFCGTVIALALMKQVHIGVGFDRVLFNQLAGLDVQLEDIKDTDPTWYRSCKQVLDMDADLLDSDVLGLTFVIEFEQFGSRKVVELQPGGDNIKVNSSNKAEYVKEMIRHRFIVPTTNQVAQIFDGFREIFSNRDLSLFFRCITFDDLNRMLRGSESDISVEDWKAHTFCSGYRNTSREITWFWKIVEEMSPEKRRLLLFFWTTVKYLPFNGFAGLPRPLEIRKVTGTADHLPSSHTCFYRLCLPRYPVYSVMRERIEVIVQEHVANSFGTY